MLLHPKKLFPEVENIELLNHQNVTKRDLLNFGNLLLAEFKSISSEEEKTAQWLKSSEVRKLLKISPGTLQNLRINGTLYYAKVGGIIYYKYDDIKKLLEM
ncbi:helix-turn-helix domain-containing protein [Flavobacterium psychrophilum]|uniref:helix-turn-helix domain-containing protein n=1 Tax=Flavobacterium psychrophilum TaxID=96345 RepID=UPI000B7C18CA|nr:helix-turn-helix domain-containing protein [Flavobacterium psychrophilum]EKT4499170.1 helix-turn-helix domain-containing protein [Flavobacterium psychrophilum]EKT4553164.1 helix-turn-helix domain-containing protein [Flavobacterium psychrophilum]ELM3650829.1 helix-turn-helix domain-containing protein [Flavobacterium psychrophilum]ELM3672591.1 helix-turn-helix domain-containing protein [Flavobacterium psychrophilum]ELM3727119.1 helix-turn-helix domain-containing protein [Flavobacterium psychr